MAPEKSSESYKTFNFSELAPRDCYKLIISLIVPRPIALVSTMNAKGQGNLAPFSFFNGVSSNPPCLVISIARKPDGSKKDTLRNIEETGQFVVNTSHESMLDPLVLCGADFPYGRDEHIVAGFSSLPSLQVTPLRIGESLAHFECVRHQIVEIGDGSPGSASLVIGRILCVHARSSLFEESRVQHEGQQPLARLGGISYCGIGTIQQRAIPDAKSEPLA